MPKPKDLIREMYNTSKEDEVLVTKAFEFARDAHEGKERYSGEPYFIHVFETAKILAEIGMSATVVAVGLLHDTIEDAGVTREDIQNEFGDEILFLVEGVTKLGTLRFQGLTRHAESLRKLFVATSKDVRVIIIKLADRLHNTRTLQYVPERKQERIARETLQIYAPLSYRLGIRKITKELEDLAFPFVYPDEVKEAEDLLKEKKKDVEASLEKAYKLLKKKLYENGYKNVRTESRIKGTYSLYKKLVRKDMDVEKVHDIAAIRIIAATVADCYQILGIVHGTWQPLPGRVKDYIAFPKPNGYRSIHTDIFTGDGAIIEVQIRTAEMHREAEYGVASHLSYKSGSTKGGLNSSLLWLRQLLPGMGRGETPEKKDEEATSKDVPEWIKELNKYQEEVYDKEFLENLRNDFMRHRIFVFTPRGEVVDLPTNSTPVDFAYSIHSDIGDHTKGAKVNGKMSALSTELKNGDIVEIVTKESARPNRKWLEFVKTALAKKHIKASLQQDT